MTSNESTSRQGWLPAVRRWVRNFNRLDFDADAYERTRAADGRAYTGEEIDLRRDILRRMKEASDRRGKEIAMVTLSASDRELVDKEVAETLKRSGGIGLLEYRAKEGQRLELKSRPYVRTENDGQLVRSEMIFCNGVGVASLLQRNQIATGFQVVEKDGIALAILLSIVPEEAARQRKELMKRAVENGFTYVIAILYGKEVS